MAKKKSSDSATIDYVQNGRSTGDVGVALLNNGFDVGVMRPYWGCDGEDMGNPQEDGIQYITRNGEAVPVQNANATLLRLEWTLLDEVVVRAALPRLRVVSDIRGRGLQFTIPNGMSKTVLDTQAQSDISGATISMDPVAESSGDRPQYNLTHLPLPVIHKDFSFSSRQIATSRNGNMPLDLSMAELAARRVAEGAEQLLLGVASTYIFGGGAVYGLTNFPQRITYALSDPTASGWVPRILLLNVLAMRLLSQQAKHYGPWVLYVSLAWDTYLDDDLSIYKGDLTLRDRIRHIEGIEDVVTVDYLKGYDVLLVQMTTDVVREVVGMDITTVQWESHGGFQLNFKVLCILVPQVRADYLGNTGIVHGAVSGKTAGPTGAIYLGNGNP